MKTNREKVLDLRTLNPNVRASQIAREIDISREAVRQILKFFRLPTRLPPILKHDNCPNCGGIKRRTARVCRRCFLTLKKVELVCEYCGKDFPRSNSHVLAATKRGCKHIWCTKFCQGRWLGRTYGFKKGGQYERD